LLFKLIGGAALALALCGGIRAADFAFAAFGDTPYSPEEEKSFTLLIAGMNREKLAFVVHIGDMKAAWQPCSDELFRQRRDWFDLFHHPFVFIPGDNEWTDCRERRAGAHNPLERLGKLRELFAQGAESLGQRRMPLVRQSKEYPEHARWRHAGVLFVTLNAPGGANNARANPEEFRVRNAAGVRWLEQAFGVARKEGLRAIAVMLHANPWASPSNHYFGYREIIATLAKETRAFRGEVLVVHGDTHRHRVDNPLRDAKGAPLPNFTRVEVFGYPTMNWVRIRVSEEAGRVTFHVTPGS
jgi:hypothetical protein